MLMRARGRWNENEKTKRYEEVYGMDAFPFVFAAHGTGKWLHHVVEAS